MLAGEQNYISYRPKYPGHVHEVAKSQENGGFLDRNRLYYSRQISNSRHISNNQTDDCFGDLPADVSDVSAVNVGKTWQVKGKNVHILDDGNPVMVSQDSRLFFNDNKTTLSRSRYFIESQENLTSSTDQKLSNILTHVSYETHNRHERAHIGAKMMYR